MTLVSGTSLDEALQAFVIIRVYSWFFLLHPEQLQMAKESPKLHILQRIVQFLIVLGIHLGNLLFGLGKGLA